MRSRRGALRVVVSAAVIFSLVGCGTSTQSPLDSSEQALSGFTGTTHVNMSDVQLAALPNGRVLAVGSGGAEVYDPSTNAWTQTSAMLSLHAHGLVARLNDGRVLSFGGWGTAATKVEIYAPATNSWTALPDMAVPRALVPAITLGNGKVLVTTSYSSGTYSPAAALWDPATQVWTPTTGQSTRACVAGSAVLLNDGRAFFLCGNGAETFSPTSGTFTAVTGLAHSYDVAVKLGDGRVLLAGGNGAGTQIFDPATNQVSASGSMTVPARYQPAATLLGDGTVVLAGGHDGTNTLASVERWTPSSGSWAAAPELLQKREAATMIALSTGDGLVAGGVYRNAPNSWSNIQYVNQAELVASLTSCTPTTCAAAGKNCGSIPDGCGGTLQCGTCPSGQTCSANVCTTACVPTTCAALGASCGTVSDGCGGTLTCGGCATGETCSSNVCRYFATRGTYSAPACAGPTAICDSGSTLNGRAALGPEPGAPNTLSGSPCADGTSGTYHVDESVDQIVLSSVGGGPITAGRQVQVSVRVWTYAAAADRLDLFVTSAASFPSWSYLTTLTPTASGASTLTATFTVHPSTTVGAIRANFRYNGGAASCTFGSYDDHDDLVFTAVPPVPDTVTPTATVTAPTAGSTVSGSVTVTATASDDIGVTRVEFYDGSTNIGGSNGPTWAVTWATASVANGTHALTARAYDAAGNVGISPSVSVTVANDHTPPTATLTSPAGGAVLTGTVTLTATATDDSAGVARVDFYDGTTPIGTAYTAPYSLSWNSGSVPNGAHVLSAKATDWAGNVGTSPGVNVTVSNATQVILAATYDAIRRAPSCLTTGSGCDSGTLLNGRGSLGPEAHAPNTLNAACADGASGTYHSDESLDRLVVRTLDGSALAPGKTVTVDATVWAWSTGSSDALDLYYASNASLPAWSYLGTIVPTKGGAVTLSKTFTLISGPLQVVRGVFRYGGSAAICGVGSFTDNDDLVFAVQ